MKSIRTQILGLIAIVAAGALVALGCALLAMSRIDTMNTRSSQQNHVALSAERLNAAVNLVVADSYLVYTARNPHFAGIAATTVEAGLFNVEQRRKDLAEIVPSSESERMEKISGLIAEFIGIRTETTRMVREISARAAEAWGNSDASKKNRAALQQELTSLSSFNETRANELDVESSTFSGLVRTWLPVALILVLGGAIAGAVVFSRRSIIRPLVDLGGTMSRLTAGETQIEVPHTKRRDEIGEMARAVSVLRDSTEQVALLQEQERAAAAARLRSADAMASVVSDVGEVVSAAAAGDFSARLQIDHGDQQMQQLVDGINEINSVVDNATTEFVAALQALAAGDLTHQVPTAYRGRFAELKDAINETMARLSSTVSTIQTMSADVGLSAREINMGADDLSKRTEEQASSLEESAATTEQLAASVKAAAQAAQQAVRQAGEAMQVAQAGGNIVTDAVSAMVRIEEASKKISDITRVIDDIAFQTNLLALNAAVEAARAGDAGKGFAVVASEVRTLAQRSGEAAKGISGLISSSNTEVQAGVKLVRQAGDALTRIVAASQNVQATVSEVAAASSEQANGIEEMSQTVAHMDEMTQANAALAEQSAASASALSSKIGELNALVAGFRTGESAIALSHQPVAAEPANDSEPERLRKLAAAAFAQPQAAPRRERAATAQAPAPARKVANARGGDVGWEEF
ncbi:methyl-accepting chemotaxis protein [Bosea sp. (in: a-proteobacteria)]|uniref:methyl-accepting chemotaxis protein n=1 Tax=Bosea sp. (in: a-proteobacteria) TaxID=1871050 RepID=UPI002FC76E17